MGANKVIYCVEDDKNIQNIEVYTLKSMGFEAQGLDDGKALFAAIEEKMPRLIILDIMLDGKDGIEILKELKSKQKTKHIPIIMATAKGEEYEKIEALDLGADDYLVKPISMLEMVSRVKAVLRRYEFSKEEDSNILKYGDLEIDQEGHLVKMAGQDLDLTYKEYQLLVMLIKNQGIVLTRAQLLKEIWDIAYEGSSRTVDVHIRTLRQKLKENGKNILTIRNVGYKMEKE